MDRLRRTILIAWLVGAALSASAVSCREHEALCSGLTCAAPQVVGGAGGEASPAFEGGSGGDATAPGGAAGAAGAPLESAACRRDDDCDDRLSCNGSESCHAGQCSPGTPLKCTMGTACVEGKSAGECHFPEASPWLIVLSGGDVYGLPAAELERRDLLRLGHRDAPSVIGGFGSASFPLDGSRVWLNFYSGGFTRNSMFDVSLGPGLPGPVTPVRELPTEGGFFDPVFAADSRHAIIEDEYSGLYLFDFPAGDPNGYRGRRLGDFEYDWLYEPAFCKDSDLLVTSGRVSPEDLASELPEPAVWMFDARDSAELRETKLGDGQAAVSQDGAWIALVGSDGVELVGCERALPRFGLAEGTWKEVEFKQRGAYVQLMKQNEAFSYDFAIYSLAGSSRPVLAYSCSDCFIDWSEDERVIDVGGTLLELQGDSSPTPYAGDGVELLLGVEWAERVVDTGSSAFLVQLPEERTQDGGRGTTASSYEFGVIARDTPTRVIPILRDGTGHTPASVWWSDVDHGLALVERSVDSSAQLWLLRYADLPFTEEYLGPLEPADGNVRYAKVSPDRRGVAYSFLNRDIGEFSDVFWQPFERGHERVALGVTGEPTFGPLPP
jgi:hypothetical protein